MWILAHQCPLPPKGNADQTLCANIQILFRRFFFLFGPPLLLAQGASVLYKAASISSAPLHPRIFFRFISALLHLITIPW
jgi:hypothetical protein